MNKKWLKEEQHWIAKVIHINTKQLEQVNDDPIEVTTTKKKPKTKKKETKDWVIRTYTYKENWTLATWRPTKIDEECIKKLHIAFSSDCTVEEACAYAGISPTIYYERLKKDPKFAERMDTSSKLFLVDTKIRNKELIMFAEQESVSAWLIKNALEKRDPNYKPKAEVENNTNVFVSFVWIAQRSKDQRMNDLENKSLENSSKE